MGIKLRIGPKSKFFNVTGSKAGQASAGGKLYTYESDLVTPKPAYKDKDGTTPHTNPITLDAIGEETIWWNGVYGLKLEDADGVEQWTEDYFGEGEDLTLYGNWNKAVDGGFEDDADGDNLPDQWDIVTYPDAGSGAGAAIIDTTDQIEGANSLKFTSQGDGGGYATTKDFFEVVEGQKVHVEFEIKSSIATVRNVVQVLWYTAAQVLISTSSIYDDSITNPTSWTKKFGNATAPANARYAKARIFGCHSSDPTVGSTWYDAVKITDPLSPLIDIDGSDITVTGNIIQTGDFTQTGDYDLAGDLVVTTGTYNAADGSSQAALEVQGAYGGGLVFRDTEYSGIYSDNGGTELKFFTGQAYGAQTPSSKVALALKETPPHILYGDLTISSGNLDFNDSQYVILGDGGDYRMIFDSVNAYMYTNTGSMNIENRSVSGNINFITDDSGGTPHTVAIFGGNIPYVREFYDNTEMFRTTSTGGAIRYGASTQNATLVIGEARTGNGASWIDIVGDAFYTDYGLRVERESSGQNANSSIKHRGTGALIFNAVESGSSIQQYISGTRLTTLTSDGLGIFTSTPNARLEVEDAATTDSMLIKATQDDQVVWGLIVGNDTFSATDTDGLGLQVLNSGISVIQAKGTGSILQLGSDTNSNSLLIANNGGLYTGSATGGSQGADTINTQGYYVDGVKLESFDTLSVNLALAITTTKAAFNFNAASASGFILRVPSNANTLNYRFYGMTSANTSNLSVDVAGGGATGTFTYTSSTSMVISTTSGGSNGTLDVSAESGNTIFALRAQADTGTPTLTIENIIFWWT